MPAGKMVFAAGNDDRAMLKQPGEDGMGVGGGAVVDEKDADVFAGNGSDSLAHAA